MGPARRCHGRRDGACHVARSPSQDGNVGQRFIRVRTVLFRITEAFAKIVDIQLRPTARFQVRPGLCSAEAPLFFVRVCGDLPDLNVLVTTCSEGKAPVRGQTRLAEHWQVLLNACSKPMPVSISRSVKVMFLDAQYSGQWWGSVFWSDRTTRIVGGSGTSSGTSVLA